MDLSKRLREIAKENPEKTAFIFEEQQTTYAELDRAVQKFASGLKELGFQKGDHVALIVGNSPYYVIGLYGALRLGVTVIPINPLYTPSELSFIIKNGDVNGVITMDVLLEKFSGMAEDLPELTHYISCETGKPYDVSNNHISDKLVTFHEVLESGSTDFSGPVLEEEEVAIILYTSGTTGKPKGAMLTHRNLYSNAYDVADYLSITYEDRVIAALPMFHVFCLTVALNAPIVNGGTILIVPQFSPKEVFRLTTKHQATVFAGVPTMYNYLLQSAGDPNADFSSIKLCISGGAAMPVALLESFEEAFDVQISEGYGLSEAAPVTCFNPLDRPRKAGSIGRNIVNVENKVVDEFGEELPAGEVGELIARGPNVMKGYYKLPEETTVALRDGWLYTGDMARMDEEGYFYIVDRKKDMIVVGGFNVYPREVEEVLYKHPHITEVAVVGSPDPNTGESVTAFVVTDGTEVSKEELLAYCTEQLVKYKVPTEIEYLDELPKNTTGKILRRSLKDILQSES